MKVAARASEQVGTRHSGTARALGALIDRAYHDATELVGVRLRGTTLRMPYTMTMSCEPVDMMDRCDAALRHWNVQVTLDERVLWQLREPNAAALEAMLDEAGVTPEGDGGRVVARVCVTEVTTAGIVDPSDESFMDYVDGTSLDLAAMLEWERSLAERIDPTADVLGQGGSLFMVQSVEAHPSVRGSRIGLRTIHRALLSLSPRPGSVALLIPTPLERGWDATPNKRATTASGRKRYGAMQGYYAQMGFVLDEEWLQDSGNHVMYLPCQHLSAVGAGALSSPWNEASVAR